jgi:hypothetical protein
MWKQTEHVVLKWEEVSSLITEMVAAIPKAYGEKLGFRISRELAAELLGRLDGANESVELADFRPKLADFVSPEAA